MRFADEPLPSSFDTLILGAGLTGLSAAHELQASGQRIAVLDKLPRVGGVIYTEQAEGFTLEHGPNTGIISSVEIARLLGLFPGLTQTASTEAKRRLILKTQHGQQSFYPLPSSLTAAVTTPLFSFRDKCRILLEPFRPKGEQADESVADLVRRRLGKSFLDYAVNPFIGGIYAGDPERLITRHALPKLYALEQEHGSFIRGAIAKARRPKSPEEQLITKEIFSTRGGLSSLIAALAASIPQEQFFLSAQQVQVYPLPSGGYQVSFLQAGQERRLTARHVLSTVPAPALPSLFPFLDSAALAPITALRYAPIVQVAWGIQGKLPHFHAFGGLVPSHEDKQLLGILHPSACFPGRAPEGHSLLSVFLGGMRCPELIDWSDEEILALVHERLERLLGIKQEPIVCRIFRHRQAIPQYEKSSSARLTCIQQLEALYPGLYLGGAICDGIGIPDRVKQAHRLAELILQTAAQA